MYTQSGEINGINWEAKYNGGRSFTLTVGNKTQPYECMYEPKFGVDTGDYAEMNRLMDEMQAEIEKGI